METKKNFMKRWISSVLVLSMVLSMSMVPAFAAGRDGAEFDEKTGITGTNVASYAASPDAFVDDADSNVDGVYQTGLTVYVVTDNGAPSGQAYTVRSAYNASTASAAAQINSNKTFNSYLCYRGSALTGVLFVQDDASSIWKTVVASMLNGMTIEGLTLPKTVAEVEAAYNQQVIAASEVAAMAAAPADTCVTTMSIYVLTDNASDAGNIYTEADPYNALSDPAITGADFVSYLCYDGRVLSGILFVQSGLTNQWVLDATVLTDSLTVTGLTYACRNAFDAAATAGSIVEALAVTPDMLPMGDLSIFIINAANTDGLTYTSDAPYVVANADIDNTASHTAYLCYEGSAVAGILFVEAGMTGWEASVRDLLGDMTVQGVALPRLYPASLTCGITVKASASVASVKAAAFNVLLAEYPDYPIENIDWGNASFAESGAITATVEYDNGELATVIFVMTIEPVAQWTYTNQLVAIPANSAHNISAEALLSYVNADLTIMPVVTGSYAAALGTPVANILPAFTWDQCNKEWTARGGVIYTFTQVYNGQTFVRTVEVTSASTDAPVVRINYNNSTVNTATGMKWSLNKNLDISRWYNCSENMTILKDWLGQRVYFVYPATDYAEQSAMGYLDVPERADIPEYEPELSATSHSVTILNIQDFGDAEFSLDGINWYQPAQSAKVYTFSNLEPDTLYTVYARTCAWEGIYLASDTVYNGIYTTETVDTEFELNYDSPSDDKGVVDLTISLAPNLTNKVLVSTLDEVDFSKFITVLSKYLRSYSEVEVNFNLDQFAELGETNTINGSQVSFPYSVLKNAIAKGTVTINYETEMVSFTVDQTVLKKLSVGARTFTFETEKMTSAPTSSAQKWLKEQYKAGLPIYRLNYRCDTTALSGGEVLIPVETSKKDVEVKAVVTYVTTRGVKTEIDAKYSAADGGIVFTYSGDGYYVINITETAKTPLAPMNFTDVPKAYWGYAGIEYCYNHGIMVGTETNKFSPNATISKGQIVTMLARLAGADLSESVSYTGFSDVATTSWYASAAKWARDNNLITTATFSGDQAMSRQDIATMLYAYLTKVEGINVNANILVSMPMYDDAYQINSSALTAVSYVRYLGIMNGVGNNDFNPKGTVTRAQMATMAMRLNELVNPEN